jgi:hypothetical protein
LALVDRVGHQDQTKEFLDQTLFSPHLHLPVEAGVVLVRQVNFCPFTMVYQVVLAAVLQEELLALEIRQQPYHRKAIMVALEVVAQMEAQVAVELVPLVPTHQIPLRVAQGVMVPLHLLQARQ